MFCYAVSVIFLEHGLKTTLLFTVITIIKLNLLLIFISERIASSAKVEMTPKRIFFVTFCPERLRTEPAATQQPEPSPAVIY